jgi:hypothetical protein
LKEKTTLCLQKYSYNSTSILSTAIKCVDQIAETFRCSLVPESILTVEGGEGMGWGKEAIIVSDNVPSHSKNNN